MCTIILLKIGSFKGSSCPIWCLLSSLNAPTQASNIYLILAELISYTIGSLPFWLVLCLFDWWQLLTYVLTGIPTSCDKTYLVTNYRLKFKGQGTPRLTLKAAGFKLLWVCHVFLLDIILLAGTRRSINNNMILIGVVSEVPMSFLPLKSCLLWPCL